MDSVFSLSSFAAGALVGAAGAVMLLKALEDNGPLSEAGSEFAESGLRDLFRERPQAAGAGQDPRWRARAFWEASFR